jgi:DNA repair protein RAD50
MCVVASHQEDSLWPLSDAKTLKDKFDDIFAATRYTKALEAIHKLRKEKTTEIKLLEADLRVLESNLETAHKLEDDLEGTKKAIKAKAERSEQYGNELAQLEAKLAKLGVRQEEIKQMQDAIAHMQAQKDVMMAERAKAAAKMESDYSDSDAELHSIYASFKANHQQLLRTIEEKTAQLQQLETDCANSERDMAKLNENLGKLAAQEADYRRKKEELRQLALRLASGSGGANAAAAAAAAGGGGDPSQLLVSLQRTFASKQSELEQQRLDARALDSRFEADLHDVRKQESQINEAARIKQEQITTAKRKRSEATHVRHKEEPFFFFFFCPAHCSFLFLWHALFPQ